MQCLEVSGAVRLIYGSLGVKRLITKIRLRCTVSKKSKLILPLTPVHVWASRTVSLSRSFTTEMLYAFIVSSTCV